MTNAVVILLKGKYEVGSNRADQQTRITTTQKLTNVSEVLTASIIALMMEAVSTSETSVNFYRD
jgi:hypothetical protein